MNAGTLQLISIIAFSLAGVLTLISIYLFLKMDVRGIIDDLSGKSAERQIMAMREENNRQKNPLSKRSAKSSETRKSSLMERTTVELKNEDDRNRQAVKWLEQEKVIGTIAVKENDKQIVLQAKDFTYVLDKRTGLFENMQFAGRSYINHPMELNIWRAPTDNDMYIKLEWKKAHYDAAYTRAYRIEVLQNKHGVLIMEHLAVVADTVQKILDVEMTWKINEDGKIEAVIEAVKDKEFPDLPRFGIRMFLNKKMDEITYFGMGPQESYRDKHQASCHGLFRSKVAQMHEDYIRPQENGSHYDCDYVELTNGQCGIAAVSKNPFSFLYILLSQRREIFIF